VQRLVKNLRSKAARQLLSSAEITLSIVAFQADSTLPIDCAVYLACHRAGDDPTLRNGEAAA
jgi:hypothetical protein